MACGNKGIIFKILFVFVLATYWGEEMGEASMHVSRARTRCLASDDDFTFKEKACDNQEIGIDVPWIEEYMRVTKILKRARSDNKMLDSLKDGNWSRYFRSLFQIYYGFLAMALLTFVVFVIQNV